MEASKRRRDEMLNNLTSQAEDLYFALNGTNDEATRKEIERDLNIFLIKLDRMVASGDLRPAVAKGIKKIATH